MRLQRIRLRLIQALRHLRPGSVEPSPLLAYLTPEAATVFSTLLPADQRHALMVAAALEARGAAPSLVMAGLLHDIGKAVQGIPVRLPDRVAKVVLARVAPGQLARIAEWEVCCWPLGGVWVLSRHARYGADLVRGWGYPNRVAWLVEHHEDSNIDDEQLALLVAIDDDRPIGTRMTGNTHD